MVGGLSSSSCSMLSMACIVCGGGKPTGEPLGRTPGTPTHTPCMGGGTRRGRSTHHDEVARAELLLGGQHEDAPEAGGEQPLHAVLRDHLQRAAGGGTEGLRRGPQGQALPRIPLPTPKSPLCPQNPPSVPKIPPLGALRLPEGSNSQHGLLPHCRLQLVQGLLLYQPLRGERERGWELAPKGAAVPSGAPLPCLTPPSSPADVCTSCSGCRSRRSRRTAPTRGRWCRRCRCSPGTSSSAPRPAGSTPQTPSGQGGPPELGAPPPTPHTAPQHPAFTSIQVLTNSSMVRTASSSSTYTSRSSKAAGREQGGRSGGVLATPPGGGGEPGAFVKGRGSCTHGHAAPPPLPPPHPRA